MEFVTFLRDGIQLPGLLTASGCSPWRKRV